VKLTVLGMSGTWPPARGATCGYLLSEGDTHVWLDAGTGTFARLQEYIDVSALSAIVITHGHPDHFIDVIPCFYARHYGGLGEPHLPFYSPEGFVDLMSLLVAEGAKDVMGEAYDFHTVADGDRFSVGPMAFTTFEMVHVGVHAMGFRVEGGDGVLAYTGDSGPCDAIVEMSRGADILMAEATYQNDNRLMPFHMSAEQVGEHAAAAGVPRVILTHLVPGLDPEISRKEAAAVYDGVTDVAFSGMTVEIGA
jgi:ribonuclease BN (tRNA processing enzyme)